jgi:hypothetical protein
VTLPAERTLGIVRRHLPAQAELVQLDGIELKPAQSRNQRWDP